MIIINISIVDNNSIDYAPMSNTLNNCFIVGVYQTLGYCILLLCIDIKVYEAPPKFMDPIPQQQF